MITLVATTLRTWVGLPHARYAGSVPGRARARSGAVGRVVFRWAVLWRRAWKARAARRADAQLWHTLHALPRRTLHDIGAPAWLISHAEERAEAHRLERHADFGVPRRCGRWE